MRSLDYSIVSASTKLFSSTSTNWVTALPVSGLITVFSSSFLGNRYTLSLITTSCPVT